jgi:hypothetical protein
MPVRIRIDPQLLMVSASKLSHPDLAVERMDAGCCKSPAYFGGL